MGLCIPKASDNKTVVLQDPDRWMEAPSGRLGTVLLEGYNGIEEKQMLQVQNSAYSKKSNGGHEKEKSNEKVLKK